MKRSTIDRIPVAIQLALVALVAFLITKISIMLGAQAMRQCAVEYPHEGQCGLEGMAYESVGFLSAVILFIGGTIAALVRWSRERNRQKNGG